MALHLSVALAAAPLTACTLAGAGIGAGIDSMIPGPFVAHNAPEFVRLESGERVDLGLRNGARVRGRYLGTHGPGPRDPETYLLVEADGGVASVPSSELQVVGVETTGNGWIYGGVIGLTIDVALVVVTVIALQNWKMDMHGAFSDSGF